MLLLSLFRLILFFVEEVQAICEQYLHMPLANTIVNLLFFWLLATLLVAYRHWQGSVGRELELERVVASINPDVLIVVQPDRTISSCNSAVRTMFGREPEDVIGMKTDLLYGDRRTDKTRPEIRECLDKVGFHVGYATAKRRDGSALPLEIVTGSLHGRPGAVVLMRDISQLRQAQEQLLAAKEKAETATKEKSEALEMLKCNYEQLRKLEELRDKLTSMIVHDLKSPIGAVHGYLELIARTDKERLSEGAAQHLSEASHITVRVREMILTLLDVSRMDKDELPLDLAEADLASLLQEASEMLGSQGAAEMVVVEPPADPVLVLCDGKLIRRVLINLLDNAIKFSPSDESVAVCFDLEGPNVLIKVSDLGPGIPEEHCAQIFELFGQVEAREFSTGIGLAFCKLAVEAHGGEIRLTSKPGEGSTFCIVLPRSGPSDRKDPA
jgi:PAS domain S-box-containing protein